MGFRQRKISRSILDAIFSPKDPKPSSIVGRLLTFFSLFYLALDRYRADLFNRLRQESWEFDEDEYRESFRNADKKGRLKTVGDLGYSGSTFFTTPNSKFLIKSLPRHFENSFFRKQLLEPYAEHIRTHPSSLLVRITDLVCTRQWTLGSWIGTAPSHHIIMENVLYGQSSDKNSADKWETYDLKPLDYFYPERDVANGALAPESVKERLVDKFEDKVRVTRDQRDDLLKTLSDDTKLLEDAHAVDYSLFLVRRPAQPKSDIPAVKCKASPWRAGLTSSDGKWVYRVVLLDFFWARDAFHAKAMSGLINFYNVVGRQGPMTITTSPDEYRQRFMKMVGDIVVVHDEVGSS